MKYDRKVRFAALVDNTGRILDGGMREGLLPIEPLEKTPELIAKLVSTQESNLTEFFGGSEYSIFAHEHVIAMIFKLKEKSVLVTVDRRFALTRVAGLNKLAKAWD